MAYNMTWTGTANNLYDLTFALNGLTFNILGMGLVVGIFIFVYSKTLERGTGSAMMAGSFTSSIIGTLLWYAELVPFYFLIIVVNLFLISVVVRFMEG